MSNAMPDPVSATREALDLKTLGRQARKAQLSGNALIAVGLSLAVLSAALLLWAGITTGAAKSVVLVLAALLMPLRLLANRLSAVTRADGIGASTNSLTRRWLGHWEAAGLMAASGLCLFGEHQDLGLILGLAAGGLLLLARLRTRGARPIRLYPTLILAGALLLSALESLWGWNGQSLIGGLSVVCVVLAVQALRPGAPRQDVGVRDA